MSTVAPWGSVFVRVCVCACVCVSCNQATRVLRPPGLLPLQAARSPAWQGITGLAAFMHSFIHPSIHSHSLHMIIHLFSRLCSRGYWDVRILRIKYSLFPKRAAQLRAEAGWGLSGQAEG